MSSTQYHESPELLSDRTRDTHRALVSLMEELEAIDWYQQRAEACTDGELAAVLKHNMQEEIEHAAMALEWLRRRHPQLDEQLRRYLHREGSIIGGDAPDDSGPEEPKADGSLGIGSLREGH